MATAFTGRMLQKALEEAKQDPEFAQLATKITASAGSIAALTALLQGGDIDLSAITGGWDRSTRCSARRRSSAST